MPAERGSGDRRTSKRIGVTRNSRAGNRLLPCPGLPTPGPSNSSWDTNNEVSDIGTREGAESAAPTPVDVPSMVQARMTNGRAKLSKLRKGKSEEGHIPRPPNSFIIFRSEYGPFYREMYQDRRVTNKQISRAAGAVWNQLSMAKRQPWEKKAMEAKEAHKAQYPDYQYRPRPPNCAKNKKKKSNSDRSAEEPQAAASIGDAEDLLSYFLSYWNQRSNGMQSSTTGHLPTPVSLLSGPSPPSFPSPKPVPVPKEFDLDPFHLQLPGFDMSDTSLRPENTVTSTRRNAQMHISHLFNLDFDAFELPGTSSTSYHTRQLSPEEFTYGPLLGNENLLQDVPNSNCSITLQDGEHETDVSSLREPEILNPFSVDGSCASTSTVASTASRQPCLKPEQFFHISDEDFQWLLSGSARLPFEHSEFGFDSLKEGIKIVPAEDEGLAGSPSHPSPYVDAHTN
ncbi:hypothetical protein CPC08DRAFT_769020 [Agrocybe pediades]|nr:hypothetical protein CPC08DRAFT_769020 [Agrocybe pediades]